MSLKLLAAAAMMIGCSFQGAPSTTRDGGPDASDATDPWLMGFDARRVVTIDNTSRGAIDDFVARVRLDDLDLGDKVGPQGEGIRFASRDAQTLYPYEIETWSDPETAVVWLRTSLPAADTASLYLYYDQQGGQTGTSAPAAVFASFDAVYHFADTFVDGGVVNSAIGQLPLEASNLSSSDTVIDLIGPALELDNNGEELEAQAASDAYRSLPGAVKTYEAWFRAPANSLGALIDTRANVPGCEGATTALFNNGEIRVQYALSLGSCTTTPFETTTTTYDDDQWHHIAHVVDRAAGAQSMYVDGALFPIDLDVATTGGSNDDTLHVGNNFAGNAQFFGRLDEIRLGPERSPDWFDAQHENITVDAPNLRMVKIADEERR